MKTTKQEVTPVIVETIHQRRAVRAYLPDRVAESTINTLLDAAVHAPTAMHLEPWAFVVIQDAAVLQRLSDRAIALATEHGDHLAQFATPGYNIFYDARTLIVICGKPLGSFVTADCWLAAENVMLAACGLGLGTCCIGFAVPVLNTADVKARPQRFQPSPSRFTSTITARLSQSTASPSSAPVTVRNLTWDR